MGMSAVCSILGIERESKGCLLEIHSRNKIYLEGTGRIKLYTRDEIKIYLPTERRFLSVKGNALSCSAYNKGALCIVGEIFSVSFEEREGGQK